MDNYFLFGLQRTGTNYINQLIRENLYCRYINSCPHTTVLWKHSITCPTNNIENIPTIVIYKNPYIWIESLCFRKKMDWCFTQKGFEALEGPEELMVGTSNNSLNIKILSQAYKKWYESWILPKDKNIYIIKYEELLMKETREAHLKVISQILKPNKQKSIYEDIPMGEVFLSQDFDQKKLERYRKNETLYLNPNHKKIITETITKGIISSLGYQPQN